MAHRGRDRRPVPSSSRTTHGLFGSTAAARSAIRALRTLSFHETKNFICGEGGALVLNEERDVARAHVLYDKGTNRRAFMLGQVDKYSWQDIGSSFGLSEVLTAMLYGQLEQREVILAKRRAVSEYYETLLAPMRVLGASLPEDREPAYHMYYVLLRDSAARDLVSSRCAGDVQPTFRTCRCTTPAATGSTSRPTECPVRRHQRPAAPTPLPQQPLIEQADRVVRCSHALVAAQAQTRLARCGSGGAQRRAGRRAQCRGRGTGTGRAPAQGRSIPEDLSIRS
jgi:dTDP-4-amino-4,6-dideoxygalactose transaminase